MSAGPAIRVSALQDGRLARDLESFRPTHVVSLLDLRLPDHRAPTFTDDFWIFQRRFDDVEDDRSAGPVHQVIADLIAFLRDWVPSAQDARLLCHCHMGASRSTAAAYIATALHAGPGAEADAFARFLTFTEKPWPNLRMVSLADGMLGRGGALIAPLEDYRRTYPRRIDAYRRLNARRGIYG